MNRPVAVESAIGPNHVIDADLISSVEWNWMGQNSVRLGLDGENFAVVTEGCARNMQQAGMLPGFPPVPSAPLSAEDGAEMQARVEPTDDNRYQASYYVQLDEKWRVQTQTGPSTICDSRDAALEWLDQQAARLGFANYRVSV